MDVQKLLGQTSDVFTAKRVYGEPYEQAGTTVIPAAVVIGGGGGGGGEQEGDSENGPGSGGGSGFGIFARPVGAYVIRNGEVRWEPITDPVGLAMVAAGVALSTLTTVRLMLKLRRR